MSNWVKAGRPRNQAHLRQLPPALNPTWALGQPYRGDPVASAFYPTSLLFGALHVFSNGGATTVPERLVYALMAMGFGLALAVCRGGSLWLAIGFHLGFNVFHQLFVTPKASAPFELTVFAGLVIAAGTIHLTRMAKKAALLPPALAMRRCRPLIPG